MTDELSRLRTVEVVFVLVSAVVFVVCDTRTESSPDSGGSLCFLLSVVVFVVFDRRTEPSANSGGSLCFSV